MGFRISGIFERPVIVIFFCFFIGPLSKLMLVLGAGSSFSCLTLTTRPDPFTSFPVLDFVEAGMDIAWLIISFVSLLHRLFVNEWPSAESIGIMRVRVLVSMIDTVFDKSCSRMSSMNSKRAGRSIPFLSAASPSFRPHS